MINMYFYDIFQNIVNLNPIVGYSINKFFHKMLTKTDLGDIRKFIRDNKKYRLYSDNECRIASLNNDNIRVKIVIRNGKTIQRVTSLYVEYNLDEDSYYDDISTEKLNYKAEDLFYPSKVPMLCIIKEKKITVDNIHEYVYSNLSQYFPIRKVPV